ncbi:restriction endonuclease subunit S [Saccharococcus caldoxylosilyticus]|uniref:restriction endonuclease subunit S n=1 Tax=Saccharococcus caldoxylosilyticus TaxID=81408 RepID=UPI003D3439C2
MTVTLKRLGDIATYVNGYAFKPTDWKNKGLPIIRIQNLTNPDSPFNYYQGEIDDKYIVNKGDILISWSASLGVFEWLGEKAVLNQHIFKVIFDKEDIDKSYFKYIVQRSLERALKYLHGSTMKHITKKYFDNILVPIPDLVTQKKIAKVLDKAQELIDKRKAQIEALEQLVQSLFWEMFGTYLTSNRNKMFFGELVKEFRYGTSVKSGEFGYPILRIPNIVNGIIDESDLKYCELPEKDFLKLKLQENDLLFVRTNGNPNYVGRCASVTKKQEGYVYASYLIRARIDLDKLNTEYVTKYMNSVFGRHEIIQKATTSAGQYNINTEGLGNILIPVPPLNLQEDFARKIKLIDAKKAILQRGLLELENMFNSLMQRAFKGELFND